MVCGAPLDERGRVPRGDRVVIRAIINLIPGEGGTSHVVANTVHMERALEVNK